MFDWDKLVTKWGLVKPQDLNWDPVYKVGEYDWLVEEFVYAEALGYSVDDGVGINSYCWAPNIVLFEWMKSGEINDREVLESYVGLDIPRPWPYDMRNLKYANDFKRSLDSLGIFNRFLPHIHFESGTEIGQTLAFDRTQLFFWPFSKEEPYLIGFRVMTRNARVGNGFMFC